MKLMTSADELTELCATAHDVVIVAPYVKESALRHVLAAMRDEARVTCVTRWTIQDLVDGASDVAVRRLVLGVGGEFRLHPRLHAKYFRFDDQIRIGSANVTNSGLGLSSTPNVELLCAPSETYDFVVFEREVIDESYVIDEKEARVWESFVELRSVFAPEPWMSGPKVAAWYPATREPLHVWLGYQGREADIPSADERRMAARDLRTLTLPAELDREQFETLLAIRLLNSRPVQDVRQVAHLDDLEAWDELGSRWSVTRGEALRRRSTVENWLSNLVDSARTLRTN